MWRHWCPEEQAWISVCKGQPCNWCEATQAEWQAKRDEIRQRFPKE
jgi:hypothetical protein